MEEPLIVCDNLVKIYKVANLEVVALQGLDLVVKRGELLGVVGASGSGKSTLMNILGGLDRPSAGRVWVDGYDLLKLSDFALDRYRRAKVGFVWQQGARNLVPYLNALENVALPMTLAGATGRRKRQRAEELLAAVGLAERRRHTLQQMSGGEQQRVAIAVALANNPTLLLADEPTGEVDSATALTIYQTFRTLNEQYGLTTIIVSHDPGIAYHVHRVVAIRDGRTSSETVRQPAGESANQRMGESADGRISESANQRMGEAAETPAFEELVVVDSAGRLQVPKEYLQRLDIKGRVRLELREGEIAIRPAQSAAEAHEAEKLAAELAIAPKARGIAGWLRRRRPSSQRITSTESSL
jgi:ABC-type lipoprotein export system ATPase subunit/bifunctional DNA-binding transcriptional regulator/antitoxin component of YhaV-PrlF toxin-antitoxin module